MNLGNCSVVSENCGFAIDLVNFGGFGLEKFDSVNYRLFERFPRLDWRAGSGVQRI